MGIDMSIDMGIDAVSLSFQQNLGASQAAIEWLVSHEQQCVQASAAQICLLLKSKLPSWLLHLLIC